MVELGLRDVGALIPLFLEATMEMMEEHSIGNKLHDIFDTKVRQKVGTTCLFSIAV